MSKKKIYKCVVSGKNIPAERVEALIMLGIPEERWTCVEHAFAAPRKGIYLGENGTSELLIVDKVYDDSVRSVFRNSKKEVVLENDDSSEVKSDYNEKELSYYTSDEEQVDPDEKVEIIKRHEP
jgi:hypothetical protein